MKRVISKLVLFAFILCFTLTANAQASAPPGSTFDPIVSESLLDNRLENMMEQFTVMMNEFRATMSTQLTDHQLDIIVGDVVRTLNTTGASAFKPVHLLPGQILIGGEGTEIILNSGIATAWIQAANGLSDITAATEVMHGQQVSLRHLLIVPRADGRGVRAVHECWLLVKGSYTISN